MFCSVIQGSFSRSPRELAAADAVGGPQARVQKTERTRPGLSRASPHVLQHRSAQHAGAVQRHANGSAFQLPANLASFARGGQRLPEPVRQQMECALGANFSDVRVHVGPEANAIGALAFTHGSSIYFAPGQYDPHTPRGQQLLGHELTHVLQQRAGRVRNPFGSGVAVVQDHALEAEAERMGQRAAAHRLEVRAKLAQPAVQRSSAAHISAPITAGPGSYRLVADVGGRQIGSVMVHAKDKASIEVTDLGVDQSHREHGVGQMLIASAARTGLQFRKSKMTLAAQDNGNGRLTQWYKRMGFAQVGVNKRGYPQLEAPISRVLAGAAQRREAHHVPRKSPLTPSAGRTYNPVQWNATVLRNTVFQRMDSDSFAVKKRKAWELKQLQEEKDANEKALDRLKSDHQRKTRGTGDKIKDLESRNDELEDVEALPIEPTAPAYFVDESGKIQKILLGDRPGWNHGAKAALKAGKLLAGGYVYCHLKGKHADPAAIVKSHGGPSLDHVPAWKTRKAGLKTYKICCEGRHYTASSEFEAAVLSHQGQLVLVHKSCNSAAQAHGFRADVDTASLCKLVEKCPGDTCTLLKAYAFLDDAKKGGGREGKRTKGVSGIDQSVTVTLYYEDGNVEHRTFN